MSTDLVTLFPSIDEIDQSRLQSVSERLTAVVRDQFPDIDVTPGSVFSDHILRAMVYLVASAEQATDCVLGDVDLNKILQGEICDCDRVRDYLESLGVYAGNDIPTIATVRLTYNSDVIRTVQNSARFVFADDIILRPLTTLSGSITIQPSDAAVSQPDLNMLRLSRDRAGTFYVDIPCYSAASIEATVDGSTGSTDVSDSTLVSVVLVSPLVPFSPGETIKEMAQRAQKVFPSSALTTRSSLVSFFANKMTNLAGVSSAMPGDLEMQRGGANLFGVQRNAVDIYPKGKSVVTNAESTVTVLHNTDASEWVGLLNLPHTPLRIRGFYTEGGELITPAHIVGASIDQAKFPGLSGAFSPNEELGVKFSEADGNDYITRSNSPDVFDEDSFSSSGAGVIELDGQYNGNVFSGAESQSLRLTGEGGGEYTLTNLRTGETVTGMTLDGTNLDLNTGSDPALPERWLNGITVTITTPFDAGDMVDISFTAEYGRVRVVYDYDPFVAEARQLVGSDAVSGAFDIEVLSPRPCVLNDLRIRYRTEFGRWVDTGLALNELDSYVNQAIFPASLEDSRLSDILLFAGASGVRNIEKTATLYTTLATHYSSDRLDESANGADFLEAGTDYEGSVELDWGANQTNLEAVILDDSDNNAYAGPRNTQFLLDRADITLVEQRD
jgi:hypothetical protein